MHLHSIYDTNNKSWSIIKRRSFFIDKNILYETAFTHPHT